MEVIHQGLGNVQNTRAQIYWFVQLSLFAKKSSQKIVSLSKLGFIANLFAIPLDVTKRIFTRFLTFSIVFPKTLLFISLKKYSSKSFLAAALSLVLRLIYFRYCIPQCTFVTLIP